MSEFGKRVTLAFRSGAEQHRAHACGDAHAIGVHVASHELHRVIDRQTRGDGTTRRVDIDVDVLLGVFHLQKQHLRDDKIGDVIVNRSANENDAVFQQPGIDVERALSPAGLLDDGWNQIRILHNDIML